MTSTTTVHNPGLELRWLHRAPLWRLVPRPPFDTSYNELDETYTAKKYVVNGTRIRYASPFTTPLHGPFAAAVLRDRTLSRASLLTSLRLVPTTCVPVPGVCQQIPALPPLTPVNRCPFSICSRCFPLALCGCLLRLKLSGTRAPAFGTNLSAARRRCESCERRRLLYCRCVSTICRSAMCELAGGNWSVLLFCGRVRVQPSIKRMMVK